MIIELNEEQLDMLKESLLVNSRLVRKELILWAERQDNVLAESCKRQLEIIREIENKIYKP